jgi:hypothetical protein
MRLKQGWFVVVVLLVSACSTLGALSDSERAGLADPPRRIADDVAALLPGALAFIDDSEREILRRGRPLTAEEARIAQAVGVAHPEQVRVLVSNDFIQPRDRAFVALARRLGIDLDAGLLGRTSGHGVQLRHGSARSRRLLAHELTHVAQYERMGTAALLRQYFVELLVVGYERSPIEAEARANEPLGPERP